MKKILAVALLLLGTALAATPLDSIGIEKKNGKIYILHKVDVKESLYSISRKYGVKVDDIRSANPDMKTDELKVGQTILVPSSYKASSTSSSSNGKTHVVDKKETYYSISRTYGVSVEDLKKANPGKEALKVGEKINIPTSSVAPKVEKESDIPDNPQQKYKTHKVEAKETLYGISKEYGVEIDAVKKANPELADGLKPGMEIKIPVKEKEKKTEVAVVEKKDTQKIAPKKTVVKEEPKATTKVVEEPKKEPKQEIKPEVIPEEKEPEKVEVTTETVSTKGGFDKIEEKGVGELMDSKTDAPKFQALHRTAIPGTIIQVVNQSNGQKIFVRVIGKLEGGDNSVIIKLSQRAMERLQAKDNRINVNLSYIP